MQSSKVLCVDSWEISPLRIRCYISKINNFLLLYFEKSDRFSFEVERYFSNCLNPNLRLVEFLKNSGTRIESLGFEDERRGFGTFDYKSTLEKKQKRLTKP